MGVTDASINRIVVPCQADRPLAFIEYRHRCLHALWTCFARNQTRCHAGIWARRGHPRRWPGRRGMRTSVARV